MGMVNTSSCGVSLKTCIEGGEDGGGESKGGGEGQEQR